MSYLTSIFNYVKNLQITVQQAAIGAVAAMIGALILVIRAQGSQIHKLQVQLLEKNISTVLDKDNDAVSSAKSAYQEALDSYLAHGGKI